jgi:hypothetical protein
MKTLKVFAVTLLIVIAAHTVKAQSIHVGIGFGVPYHPVYVAPAPVYGYGYYGPAYYGPRYYHHPYYRPYYGHPYYGRGYYGRGYYGRRYYR